MWYTIFIIIIIYFSSFAQNGWKSEIQKPYFQKGYEITEIEKNLLEVKNKSTGLIIKQVDISDRGIISIENSPYMQVFDLINADTNLYNFKYKLNRRIMIAGMLGYPMNIEDLNNNGKLDFVGSYKIEINTDIADCAVIELHNDSSFTIQKIYEDSVVNPLASTDADADGLKEINFKFAGGQVFHNYESTTDSTFPDTLNYIYRMWQISGAVGSETYEDLDNDGIIDVVYKGDDTLAPSGTKIFVAEYDNSINNFVKRYSYRPQNWRISGFSIGDFDYDGLNEFVTGSIFGDVYVFENIGNDSYNFIFNDTINTSNAYLNCATNDIDNNGKIEFFIGGSSYYGGIGATKVYWFEADGNNNYIKRYTFFLLGTDVLGTTEMYSYDVNADNVDDLVFAFGGSVVILIWNQNGYFDLHYLDWLEDWEKEIHSVNIYDTYGTGRPDLYVSYNDYYKPPAIYSNYYKNNFITGIYLDNLPKIKQIELFQNYPNPFNNKTTIKFCLHKQLLVQLIIYNINGKEVIKLFDNQIYNPGEHSVTWTGKNKDGKEVSSGIYLYQLKSKDFIETCKILLLK